MDTHLNYIKTIDRSSELTRAAERARRTRRDRFAASEVETSVVTANRFPWVRHLLAGRRRPQATVA